MNTDRIPCDDTHTITRVEYALYGYHSSDRAVMNFLKGKIYSVNNRFNRNKLRMNGRTVNMVNYIQTF